MSQVFATFVKKIDVFLQVLFFTNLIENRSSYVYTEKFKKIELHRQWEGRQCHFFSRYSVLETVCKSLYNRLSTYHH